MNGMPADLTCIAVRRSITRGRFRTCEKCEWTGEPGRGASGQLLITTTTAPTRAIRTHNNSLSPQRLNRVRTSDLLFEYSSYKERGKADACMIISDFPVFSIDAGTQDRAIPHRSHCALSQSQPFLEWSKVSFTLMLSGGIDGITPIHN